MPTATELMAKKKQASEDRFKFHTLTSDLLFLRDMIHKENHARVKAGRRNPYANATVHHPWEEDRVAFEKRRHLSRRARHWRVDYPWSTARVDRSEVDGSSRGHGLKQFDTMMDTWHNCFHRDATDLSYLRKDGEAQGMVPRQMPEPKGPYELPPEDERRAAALRMGQTYARDGPPRVVTGTNPHGNNQQLHQHHQRPHASNSVQQRQVPYMPSNSNGRRPSSASASRRSSGSRSLRRAISNKWKALGSGRSRGRGSRSRPATAHPRSRSRVVPVAVVATGDQGEWIGASPAQMHARASNNNRRAGGGGGGAVSVMDTGRAKEVIRLVDAAIARKQQQRSSRSAWGVAHNPRVRPKSAGPRRRTGTRY